MKNIFLKVPIISHILFLMFLGLVVLAVDIHAEEVKISKYDSPAFKATDWTSGGHQQQLNFRYANAKATLRKNGDILIEGDVKHIGLFCGTYSGGIRFGKGSPGCVDVQWLTESIYLTSRKQCNNSVLQHAGAGTDPSAVENFEQITCGQFLLKCTGTCQ